MRNPMVRVDIDETKLSAEFQKAGRKFVGKVARDIRDEAKRIVPVRTGRLRESIRASRVKVSGPFRVEAHVSANRRYARFVHEGTRPHIILARRARALRFYWPRVGKVVFFKSVNHPGNDANPFLDIAATRVAGTYRGTGRSSFRAQGRFR